MQNIILEAAANSKHYKSATEPSPGSTTPNFFFYQIIILIALVLFAVAFPAAGM